MLFIKTHLSRNRATDFSSRTLVMFADLVGRAGGEGTSKNEERLEQERQNTEGERQEQEA